MTEIEKIRYAKSFIDKLANGINPLDNSAVAENDIVNNIRISRCLFYVSDILRQVIDNDGIASANKAKKLPFTLSPEVIQTICVADKPLPVSKFADYLSSFADLEKYSKLPYKLITSWLINIGALVETEGPAGKKKEPTEQGKELGIYVERRTGLRGDYDVVLYNRDAQQFIIDNLDAILAQ